MRNLQSWIQYNELIVTKNRLSDIGKKRKSIRVVDFAYLVKHKDNIKISGDKLYINKVLIQASEEDINRFKNLEFFYK